MEWKSHVNNLRPALRELMRLPFFSVKRMSSRLGFWSFEKQEICLSRKLVLDHPWYAVREVLLHEMAHQMADQVFGCQNEPPHGPGFQDACRLLRANPAASGKYPALDDKVANGTDTDADSHLRKIKKLLALAKSRNRHEAQAAMVKAHQLIKKYNIHDIEQNDTRKFVSIFLGLPALRHTMDHYHLAQLIQNYYFVEGIWVSAYVMDKNKMGRVLEISGTLPNIQMASYVYDFVRRFTASQWKAYNQGRRYKNRQKIDFAIGIAQGFASRLEKEAGRQMPVKGPTDLIKIEDPQLTAYLAHRYPNTRSFTRSGHSSDDTVLRDGIEIGKKLVISKGVSSRKENGGLLSGA